MKKKTHPEAPSKPGKGRDGSSPVGVVGVPALVVGIVLGALAFLLLPLAIRWDAGGAVNLGGLAFDINIVMRAVIAGAAVGLMGSNRLGVVLASLTGFAAAALGLLVFIAVGAPVSALVVGLALVLAPLVSAGMLYLTAVRRGRIAVALAFGLVVALLLMTTGVVPGPNREALASTVTKLSQVPQAEQYGSDEELYLRIPFLMKGGESYYRAFSQAYVEDIRLDSPPAGRLNYREPLLFWVWAELPVSSPEGIRLWFIGFAVGVMAAGYWLARRFVDAAAAMLAPILLCTYFSMAATATWFGLVEFWAGGLAVVAIAAVLRRRWLLGALLIVAAVATRELMVYLVPAFVVAWVAYSDRRDEIASLLVVVLGSVAVLGLHLLNAPTSAPGAGVDFSTWTHGQSWLRFVWTLSFADEASPFSSITALITPVAALIGAVLAPRMWRKALLLIAIGGALVALYLFGATQSNYWGAILGPLTLAVAPIALVYLMPSDLASEELQIDRRAAV